MPNDFGTDPNKKQHPSFESSERDKENDNDPGFGDKYNQDPYGSNNPNDPYGNGANNGRRQNPNGRLDDPYGDRRNNPYDPYGP